MSNYRVRQVLALGDMPERQLRFLIALATWMGDEARTVRVGFETLIAESGKSHNTVRKARRELETEKKLASSGGRGKGNLTVWTALCLPETAGKGTSDVGTFNEEPKDTSDVGTFTPVDNSPKGTNREPQKVPTEDSKRYQGQLADQREPEMGFNLLAKPTGSLLSPRARESLAVAPDGAGREERNDGVIEGKIISAPDGAPSLAEEIAAAVPGATIGDAEGLIEHVRLDPQVRHPAAWLRAAIQSGTIADLYADLYAKSTRMAKLRAAVGANGTPPGPTGSRPPWCGQCREQTRMHEDDQGRPYRCPKCHPLAAHATGDRSDARRR